MSSRPAPLPPVRLRRRAVAPKSAPANAAEEGRTGRLRSLLTPLLIASVVTVPLLLPPIGPNSVPADFFNAAFILLGATVLLRTRTPFRLPLAGSYLLIVTGGLLAVTQSVVPKESLIAVLQDAYLFVWFVVVVNFLLVAGDRVTRTVVLVWTCIGVAMAGVVWLSTLGYPENIPILFDYPLVDPYGRSEGTFRDPNMAGNYLVLSLFVLWAAPRPRNLLVKLALTTPFLFGIYVTQSITALVTLAGGVAVAATVGFVARREAVVAAFMGVVALALAAAIILPDNFVRGPESVTTSLGETEVFDESLGRSNSSLSLRAERWEEAFRFFGSSIILGIGPSSTDEALQERGAPIAGEIHNDYMAGLLERGLLGALGNLFLFVVAAGWSLRVALDKELAAGGWRPAALAGGMVVILMGAMSLETLHFRHVWLFLALVVALGMKGSGSVAPVAAPPSFTRKPRRVPYKGLPVRRRPPARTQI